MEQGRGGTKLTNSQRRDMLNKAAYNRINRGGNSKSNRDGTKSPYPNYYYYSEKDHVYKKGHMRDLGFKTK